ncbi:putative alpha-L-rhamnosidase [Colletotrichum sublineola]|uniref:Putative alpha-L-rhamnosidase n=1 Tax=Colletotrichum sublineola TaxID=1173701 RepID=A0A066XT26_COLSU|nr:putative alpha-L-rhamnosidase [Colletotrichum sublineola]
MMLLPRLGVVIACTLSALLDPANAASTSHSPVIGTKSTPVFHGNGTVLFGYNDTTTLVSDGTAPAVVILDYGQNVEGHPTFEVVSVSGDTSGLEITYAESETALSSYMSDGPLPLAAAMDTYRINQYNVTGPSIFTNRLIQGAFRYQKLNLSTRGSLRLRDVGVRPTTSTTPLARLPGAFACSDEDLTRIWHVGARTVQLTEIPGGSIPDFLWVAGEEGAYAESQAPQALAGAAAAQLLHYRVDVQARAVRGGFGVAVLCDTLNSCVYLSFDLVRHIVTAHAGATAMDPLLAASPLPAEAALDTWHAVRIEVDSPSVTVALDSVPVLNLTQTPRFFGSFGIGASFGHAAYFRNITASTPAGEVIYANPLTSPSFLVDFTSGANPLDTIVDGARRDRIAYTGDLDVAVGAALASTFGTLAQNYEARGDPAVTRMLDWAGAQALPNGLFNLSDASFGGDWNYYDPAQSGIVTKFNAVYAYALQQSLPLLRDAGVDVAGYEARLADLRAAINQHLWSDDLGAYILSEAIPTGFAQDANALAILAGVPSPDAARRILATLSGPLLLLPAGPLAFSLSTATSSFARKISPYASAYHLRAALASRDAAAAKALLKSLWAPMADPANANYTGCFWETLDPDGTPGLGIATSLCHGWSAGPTTELSRFVLGVQPAKPGFVEWKVEPQTLGLAWARGRYPTARGDVAVDWRFEDGLLLMEVESPGGTKGVFEVNGGDAFVLTQELYSTRT